jgi:hypothetical protein
MTQNHLAGRCAFYSCQPLGLTGLLVRFPPQFLKQSFRQFFGGGGVDHPVPPCRLLGHNQSQTLVMTGRLDLLLLGNRPGCGWLYPLRDPNSLPPTSWTHVRVVPRLRDQLEPSLVGRGWCLT